MKLHPPVATLAAAVQANCNIADARHAADLTLCTYLLQMRELYRWEIGLPFGAALPREAIGAWIAERERQWAAMESSDFVALPALEEESADAFDPFDVDLRCGSGRGPRLRRRAGRARSAGLLPRRARRGAQSR
jgi:hypothetical protein